MPGSTPLGETELAKVTIKQIQDTLEIQKPNVKHTTDSRLKEETLLCIELTPVWVGIRLRFQQKQRVKEERVKKI